MLGLDGVQIAIDKNRMSIERNTAQSERVNVQLDILIKCMMQQTLELERLRKDVKDTLELIAKY